jgi:DNA-binding transcriptional ArsR family regulator
LRASVEELKSKALDFLETSTIAVCVGDVAKHLDISWSTARHILMELLLEGKVECEKTTKSMIFKAKKEIKRDDVPRWEH